MTKKIDVEANLEARKEEVAEHSLKNCLYIQTTEILHRRKNPADDVPPEEVVKAFKRDFPPLNKNIVERPNYEGVNLKFCSKLIVGEGTKYEMTGCGYPASWDDPDNPYYVCKPRTTYRPQNLS